MTDNPTKAQCKHCFNFLSLRSNSTLRNYITHPHCEALKMILEAGQSSVAQDGSVFVYNPNVLREQFTSLVIQQGLPFNHFDNNDEGVSKPYATKVQSYKSHYSKTVNITTDVWSALHGLPGLYLYVTAHQIEANTWQMMKRVIALKDFSVPHSRPALSKMLRKMFVNFNLEEFFLEITLDNASNNTKATERLALKYCPPMEAKESMYPVLSQMAMDLISVQATSVAFESAFSTSERLLSIRRTRLSPGSLEMYMRLKDHMDATERIQHTSNLENALDFEEEILDEEVQENKAIPHFDEKIALDEAASEARSNGSGFGG
nr:hAT family dimerisation domain containing protein [Tanacetum cinerariifolium]